MLSFTVGPRTQPIPLPQVETLHLTLRVGLVDFCGLLSCVLFGLCCRPKVDGIAVPALYFLPLSPLFYFSNSFYFLLLLSLDAVALLGGMIALWLRSADAELAFAVSGRCRTLMLMLIQPSEDQLCWQERWQWRGDGYQA